MSLKLFDFSCGNCGEVFEKLVSTNTHTCPCDCGSTAIRQVSMPSIKLDGTSGHFPTAYDRWANIREQNRKVKGKKSWAEEY